MRQKVYGSDVSREQFEGVRPLLEGVRKRTTILKIRNDSLLLCGFNLGN